MKAASGKSWWRARSTSTPRAGPRPFIALNCAAIPSSLIESELFGHEKGSFTGAHARVRGKFEIAHRGTLFLDEIGEMAPATQVKLLRVLEEREFMRIGGDQTIRVDVRVIAATNADLEELVSNGRFRRDLYYRLKVVTLTVPPLRGATRGHAVPRRDLPRPARAGQRRRAQDDQPRGDAALLRLRLAGQRPRAEEPGGEPARLRPGPGHHARAPSRRTLTAGLERGGAAVLEPGATLAEMEHELIRRTLEYTGGNRTHSAALLGIGVRTLQRKIRTLRNQDPLDADDARAAGPDPGGTLN